MSLAHAELSDYDEAAARAAALANRSHSITLVSKLAGMLWNSIEFRAEDRERYAVLVETADGDHCCLMDGDKVIEQYPCTCWRSELAAKIRGVCGPAAVDAALAAAGEK